MSTDSWIAIGVALAALVLLGLAATVEFALAVLNRVTLRALIEERAGSPRMHSVADHPQVVRSTMLLVELTAAIVIAAALTSLFESQIPGYGVIAGVGASALLLLIAGRVIPALVVSSDQTAEPESYEGLAEVLTAIARPLAAVADGMIGAGRWVLRRQEPESGVEEAHDELAGRDENSNGNGDEIEEDEHEMISGVLHLDDATAREIMVPRPDIVAVPEEMSILDVVDIARQAGHSRIPVYRDSIDTVIGVVYAKDFLRFVREDLESVNLLDLLRPAYFVPESKRVGELLQDLRKEKVHLAIVVDEYGGTAGLVTIEDILEEIVGEIQDEYDREAPLIERVGPTEIIVDGRIAVDEVADIFETEFPEGDSETIGGLVQDQLGRIPQPGESVKVSGLTIEVQSVEQHRVRKLRIARRVEPAPQAEAIDAA